MCVRVACVRVCGIKRAGADHKLHTDQHSSRVRKPQVTTVLRNYKHFTSRGAVSRRIRRTDIGAAMMAFIGTSHRVARDLLD